MSEFKIDKAIPVPEEKTSYPLQDMEVGDSFEFPIQFRPSVQTLATVAKKQGKQFRVKRVSPETCRAWRVK